MLNKIVSYKNTDYKIFHMLYYFQIYWPEQHTTTNLRKHGCWNISVEENLNIESGKWINNRLFQVMKYEVHNEDVCQNEDKNKE